MKLFLNILFFIIGLVLLIKGSDFFVSSASRIAKKLRVSPLVIGLTIVAFGTGLPEIAIGISSAIAGSTELAVSNIIGSNMFNILFILGLVSVMAPVVIKKSSKKIDLPFLLIIGAILLLFSLDSALNGDAYNVISRTESIVLIGIVVLYMYITISNAKQHREEYVIEEVTEAKKEMKQWLNILLLVIGIGMVAFGGECVSTTAQYLALEIGLSEAIVGGVIIGIATNLPELFTSITALRRGENQMAFGNLIGSNIINTGFILGLISVISPVALTTAVIINLAVMLGVTVLVMVFSYTRSNINRIEGGALMVLYVGYVVFLVLTS